MHVRNNETDAFHNFRAELEKVFLEMRLDDSFDKRVKRWENFCCEITETRIARIEREIERVRKRALAGTALTFGSLAASMVTSGPGLLAAALAGFECYHAYHEYQDSIRRDPAFFYWRLDNAARRRAGMSVAR